MAYQLVHTQEEQRLFKDIANEAWQGQKWRYDEVERPGLSRYLIRERDTDDVIGTFELLPYIPQENNSLVERDYPFYQEPEVIRQTKQIYELDKLAVREEKRSKVNLFTLMQDLMLVSKNELDSELLLSLVNPYLYGIVTEAMRLPVIGLTEPLHCDESDAYFIPSLCYVPRSESDLKSLYESMANGLNIKQPK
ncbi:MAG: hypothetical protein ACQEQ6_05500 [Pseudomonadota bacterium]